MKTEPQNDSAAPTPGPWYIGSRSGYNADQIRVRDGSDEHHDTVICAVSGIPLHTSLSEVEGREDYCNRESVQTALANARLIAGAPDMLKALQRIELQLSTRTDKVIQTLLADARAAIAKATA